MVLEFKNLQRDKKIEEINCESPIPISEKLQCKSGNNSVSKKCQTFHQTACGEAQKKKKKKNTKRHHPRLGKL